MNEGASAAAAVVAEPKAVVAEPSSPSSTGTVADPPSGAAGNLAAVVVVTASAGQAGAPSPAPWSDPSHRGDLPLPVLAVGLPLEDALARLRERRAVVIECPWAELQLQTVAALAAELGDEYQAAIGRVTDGDTLDGASIAGQSRGRWGLEDLGHKDLGAGARLVVLELEGAAGAARLDHYFASPASREKLRTALRETDRYLFLLPQGGLPRRQRGWDDGVPRLPVPFVRNWLQARYPDDGPRLPQVEEVLRTRLEGGGWSSPEELYRWLSSLRPELSVDQLLRELDESLRPEPLDAVERALDACDERDEVFLTSVFAATHLSPLTEREMLEVVGALLGERTRAAIPAVTPSGELLPPVSLAEEWRKSARSVLKRAGLEPRAAPGAIRIIGFGAAGAARKVKRVLDEAPMFLDTQLEHLHLSGLLFHPRPAISDAVVALLISTIAEQPGRLTSAWLLGTLGRRSLHTGPAAADAADEPADAEWRPRTFLVLEKLLRGVLEAAATPECTAADGSTLVNDVLGLMLHRSPSMARAAVELACRLRHAPGFRAWPWLRHAAARPGQELRALLQRLLVELVLDPEEGREVLEPIFSWLPAADGPRDGAAALAVYVLGHACGASLATPATAAAPLPPLLALLREHAPGGSSHQLGALLRGLGHTMDLERVHPHHLAMMLLPAPLLEELTPEVRERHLAEFQEAWLASRESPAGPPHSPGSFAALRMALMLSVWRLAYPGEISLHRALAAAVHEHLSSERRAVQQWLGQLAEILSRCERHAFADLELTERQRHRWATESSGRRKRLLEVREWLARPATPDRATPTPPGPAARGEAP